MSQEALMAIVPNNMGEEYDRLYRLQKVMDESSYNAYVHGRALDAIQRYRETGNPKALEDAQFYMHRVTHQVLKSLSECARIEQNRREIIRLNILNEMHNESE
jgi:hypothetical protein